MFEEAYYSGIVVVKICACVCVCMDSMKVGGGWCVYAAV